MNQTSWPSGDQARPCVPYHSRVKSRLVPGNIDDGNGAAIVSLIGMIHEGHEVALRGNTRITDPAAAGLVENLTNGILEPVAAADVAHHGKVISVGGPIRPFDIFENWAGVRRPPKALWPVCPR